MKAITIILTLLYSISLQEASSSEGNLLTMLELRSDDSISTNDLRIKPFHLEIIPPSSGVQFYRNGIIFLAQSKQEEKIPERHLSFGSVRTYASLVSDTVPTEMMPFDLKNTTLFPTEATTFSADFNTMYISMIPAKSRSEKIFRAEYTTDGWKIEEEPLEICNEDFIYSHPCLSADGTVMLFSSNQSGTVGGLDLWITRMSGEKWTMPENLGKMINSAGNELFAALDSRNNIYFSSDGHPGIGGYDIYVARYNGSTWDEPHMLPEVINTQEDELAFTINKSDDKSAFYARRTRTGRAKTQLYVIDLGKEQIQNETSKLGDYILAMADKTKTVAQDRVVSETMNIQANKETVSSDQEVQYASVAKLSKEVIPDSDISREIQSTEMKKEVAEKPEQTTPSQTSEIIKETLPTTESITAQASLEPENDEVIYRVQILANTKPVGSQNILVSGKDYKSFEYLYKGGYRTTIGEFRSLAEAVRLQSICRQNGYKEAFVVAFKNNVRSTDPALFR